MDAYLSQREQLIREDRALRPDHATSHALTPEEIRADKILRGIRTAEAETVWGLDRKSSHPHGSQQMFPGMEFLTGEFFMERDAHSDYLFVRSQRNNHWHKGVRYPTEGAFFYFYLVRVCVNSAQMPKGGLLHAHVDATVRVDKLLKLAMEQPAMHVRASGVLSSSNLKAVLPHFFSLPKSQ